MERQKNFSLKSARFLIFSFLVSSSFILTIFTVCLLKSIPSMLRDRNLEPNIATFRGSILKAIHVSNSRFVTIPVPEADDETANLNRNFSSPAETQNSSQNSQDFDRIGAVSMAISEVSVGRRTESEPAPVEGPKETSKTAASVVVVKAASESVNGCDITRGRWIYDESYPLYTNHSCPFIDEGFDCEGNGRLDEDYMKLRWQPHYCDIPRFNATGMLNLIRGKRVFVGDSINRNQWESILCLLMGAVKDPKKVYEIHGRKITKGKGIYSFKFVDYNCTVEYYVSHFLVRESRGKIGQKRVKTLRIDAIDRGWSKWKGADILIFNTANWWSHLKTKAGINYYQEGNLVHPKLNVTSAFRRALLTWSSWVDRHISPRKTRVFFRSSAPSHFRGGPWYSGGHCLESIQPLNEISGSGSSEKDAIVEDVVKHMKIADKESRRRKANNSCKFSCCIALF